MAEEGDILEDLEAADAPAAKKKPMVMIIGIIIGLLALGGGGYYAYITYFQEKPVEEVSVEGEEGAVKDVEEGVNLVKQCQKQLQDAELKVKKLLDDGSSLEINKS